jgi:hypothetical protein
VVLTTNKINIFMLSIVLQFIVIKIIKFESHLLSCIVKITSTERGL